MVGVKPAVFSLIAALLCLFLWECESPLFSRVKSKVEDIHAPDAIVVKATNASLDLSWSEAPEAISYQVFRDMIDTGMFQTQVFNGNSTKCTDTRLASGTTYYYKVQATCTGGIVARSAAISGTTIPAVPTELTVGAATPSSLAVSWRPVKGAVSYSLSGNSGARWLGVRRTADPRGAR
jgi:hypothetical protein